MTREDFMNDYNSVGEIYEFCMENDEFSDIFCYIRSRDEIDDYLDDMFMEELRYDSRWYEVRDQMNCIDEGYDWYDTEYEVVGFDDCDYEDLKEKVLEAADYDDFWDDPEEEVVEKVEIEYDEPCEPEENTVSVDFKGLFAMNAEFLSDIEEIKKFERKASEAIEDDFKAIEDDFKVIEEEADEFEPFEKLFA